MCCRNTCALVFWILSAIFWLVVGVILLTILFLPERMVRPNSPCHGLWGPTVYLHRGNLTLAQENTAEAVVTGISTGIYSEVNILASSDSVPYLFHDASLQRMTGVDHNIADVSSTELDNITILSTIDGYNYNKTNSIPTAESVIQSICSIDPNAAIDLDVKDSPSAESMVKLLAQSGCDVGTVNSSIIFAIGNPLVGNSLLDFRSQTPEVQVRTSLFLHPNSYGPVGLYFFLKTRLLHYYAQVDMISAHYTVWDRDYDVIKSYEDDGFCSAVYGIPNTPEGMARYPSASYYVVDEGPYFPDNPNGQFGGDGSENVVTYTGERGGYIGIMTIGVVGILLFLISTCMIYRNREYCCGGQSNDERSKGTKNPGIDDGASEISDVQPWIVDHVH